MLSLATALALSLATPSATGADGADFTADLQLIYRVVACAGSTPLPANLDAKVIEAHCAKLTQSMDKYRKQYATDAKAFITNIRPTGAPNTLVYPFGGGDLISALTTFPDATDITTMSLEHAGDPRRLAKGLTKQQLAVSLDNVRKMIAGLLLYNDSKTESLQKLQRGEIPGQIAFFAVALAVHGYEPVRLRYFRVEKDGQLHYITAEDIAAAETKMAKRLRSVWVSPDFSEAFSMAELEFRPIGGGPTRVHRHMGADLSDGFLKTDGGILRYLESKGRVSAMTKAASYLLWRNDFSMIRDYLLANMEVMISDSTGVPPKFATKAGFTQETWGKFQQSFLGANAEHNADFVKLWAKYADRKLPFRYGYIDGSEGKHFHMMLTKRVPKPGAQVVPSVPAVPDGGPAPYDAGIPAAPGADGGILYTDGGIPKTWLPRADGEAPRLDLTDDVLGGVHTRLVTSRGIAHLWRPAGYDPKKAGTVVYLHGYWVNADQAWTEFRLAEQFQASGRHALFVVPESPAEDADDVQWKDLGELLREVRKLAHLAQPDGPIVAVAHSGGFRTVVCWLEDKRLQQIIMLDGVYKKEDELHRWIAGQPKRHVRRLTLVSTDTWERADRLARRFPRGERREGVPEVVAELGAARHAEVLSIKSQYDHMGMVTSGKVIPLVLQLTPLPHV
jgi:hypothetical protein